MSDGGAHVRLTPGHLGGLGAQPDQQYHRAASSENSGAHTSSSRMDYKPLETQPHPGRLLRGKRPSRCRSWRNLSADIPDERFSFGFCYTVSLRGRPHWNTFSALMLELAAPVRCWWIALARSSAQPRLSMCPSL